MALSLQELLQIAVITQSDVDKIVASSQPKLKPFLNAQEKQARMGGTPLNRLLNS